MAKLAAQLPNCKTRLPALLMAWLRPKTHTRSENKTDNMQNETTNEIMCKCAMKQSMLNIMNNSSNIAAKKYYVDMQCYIVIRFM